MKRNRPLNEKKREAIIQAAINEFYLKGYEGSSMDSVAQEAQVSKATVYNHFKNKEELFLAIAHILLLRFEQSFKYDYDENKTIQKQLEDIAYKELAFLNDNENTKLIQIISLVMIQKNEIGLKLLEKTKDPCMTMTAAWFERAKKEGFLDFDSALFVSQQFIGMIKSFAFYPQMYGVPKLTKEEQDKLVQKAVEMILKQYGK